MIDIHSHIINNVDDGALNMEMSVEMAKQAYISGYTDIICTPHYIKGQYDVTKQRIQECIKNLQNELNKNDIPIKLYIGNEIYLEEDILEDLQQEKISTLNESRYILIEFARNFRMNYIEDMIFKIKLQGLVPIIAHPERYTYVQENPNILIQWIEQGALFQLNCGSIIGRYGSIVKKTSKILLKNKLVHFIGSDAHRATIFSDKKKYERVIQRIVGKDGWHRLTQVNPTCVLNNQPIK